MAKKKSAKKPKDTAWPVSQGVNPPLLDNLVEAYQIALDNHLCDKESDDLLTVLLDRGTSLLGRTVSADVQWQGGKVTNMTGTVVSTNGEFVYLKTDLGHVEAFSNTMEAAE